MAKQTPCSKCGHVKKAKRGLSANAQYHVWIKVISDRTGDDTKSIEQDLKIHFGLPILLADEELGPTIGWMLDKYDFYSLSRSRQRILISMMKCLA